MAKLPESVNSRDLADNVADLVVADDVPTVICGVQRKVNIGNFENVDIYCAIKLPVGVDYAGLQADIEAAVKYGFEVTAAETAVRYNALSAETAARRT